MAEAALEIGRRLGDKRAVAEAYWEAALLEERRREFTKATQYALKARDLMVELGDQQETARLLNDLGEIRNLMGKPEEAVQCFEDGLDLLKSVDDPVTRTRVLNGFAETQLALGDTRRALELTNKSLAILEGRDGQGELLGRAHLIQARAFLAQGHLDESHAEVDAAKQAFASLETGTAHESGLSPGGGYPHGRAASGGSRSGLSSLERDTAERHLVESSGHPHRT